MSLGFRLVDRLTGCLPLVLARLPLEGPAVGCCTVMLVEGEAVSRSKCSLEPSGRSLSPGSEFVAIV